MLSCSSQHCQPHQARVPYSSLHRSDFLTKFVPLPSPNVPSCVGALVERMAARMLIFFVRHASLVSTHLLLCLTCEQNTLSSHCFPTSQLSLAEEQIHTYTHINTPQVRPLSHTGKLQLAKDMVELQLAVGSSLYPLEQLGHPYR